MDDLSFCPFCGDAQFKITQCDEGTFFCKGCNHFFQFSPHDIQCPKCDSIKIQRSDFPTPGGEIVFHCQDCKKLHPSSALFKS
jgi:Zn finger protein HypA/HybF involved in hydrogenase expression